MKVQVQCMEPWLEITTLRYTIPWKDKSWASKTLYPWGGLIWIPISQTMIESPKNSGLIGTIAVWIHLQGWVVVLLSWAWVKAVKNGLASRSEHHWTSHFLKYPVYHPVIKHGNGKFPSYSWFPQKLQTSIYRGCPIATFDYRMVIHFSGNTSSTLQDSPVSDVGIFSTINTSEGLQWLQTRCWPTSY
jgi:hypothetical protein